MVPFIQGNILYRFPSLQKTASSKRMGRKEYVGRKWAEWVEGVEKYLEEKKWPFRLAFSFFVKYTNQLTKIDTEI